VELAIVSPHPLLRPVTSIVPLQRLTAELARLRGTDPCVIVVAAFEAPAVIAGVKARGCAVQRKLRRHCLGPLPGPLLDFQGSLLRRRQVQPEAHDQQRLRLLQSRGSCGGIAQADRVLTASGNTGQKARYLGLLDYRLEPASS